MSSKVDVEAGVDNCVVIGHNGDKTDNGDADVNANDEAEDDKKKKKKEKPEMVSCSSYYRYATALDWVFMIVAGFWGIVKGFSWPAAMILFGGMINALSGPNAEAAAAESMKKFAYLYVAVGVANIVSGYFSTGFMNISAERQANRIRIEYFRAIMRQEIGWFDENPSGALTTRLSGDIAKIKDGMGDKVSMACQWIAAFFSGFIIAFVYEWRLSLVILSTSPLLAIGGFVFSKVMSEFATKEQSAYAEAGGIAEEVIGAIRTVISFGGERYECQRYGVKLKSSEEAGKKNGLLTGASIGFTMMVMFGTYGLAFWYGAKLVGEGKSTPGDVLIAFFNILIGSFAMGHATPHFTTMAEGRGAATEVFKTIDRASKINHEEDAGLKPETCHGTIEFKGVDFVYPSREDVQIMKDFNLTMEPGSTHALVGPSGCGKSTAVALIERFYDVTGGNVYVDGIDVKDLSLKWLRDQIGLVGQEPVLFSTTIEENVRFGRDDVTMNEIEDACKKAFAHDFISELPDKYQTLCGDRGAKLSGGQKQRVAIARALVRNPTILLLDEATSALDNQSEGIVQQALEVASKGRTTLIIAHRLSTIINADKISAIGEHKIVEEGTHAELLAKEGLYHMLVTYQQDIQDGDDDVLPDLPTAKEAHDVLRRKSSIAEMKRQISSQSAGSKKKRLTSTMSESLEVDIKDPKKEKEEAMKQASFIQIMKENNRYEHLCIWLGTVGAAVNGATMPVFALLFANVIGALAALAIPSPTKDFGPTNRWAGYFALMGLIAGIANLTQIYFMSLSGVSYTKRLRARSFKALLRQNMEYFDRPENSIGALTTRLSTDAAAMRGATGVRIGSLLQNAVSMGVGVGIGFYASWKLALLTLACIPFVAFAGSIQMLQLSGTSMKSASKLFEDAGKTAAESIENMRTVASLGLEEKLIERYTASLAKPTSKHRKQAHLVGLSMGLAEAVIMFTYAAVFTYGSHLMSNGEITFNDVMKVFSAIIFGAMTIGQTMSLLPDYGKAKASAYKIFELIYSVPKIDAYSDEGNKPEARGELQFDSVTFNYPTRSELPVLKGLSFSARQGQTVALVGQSGCGKSTSVALTERFYDILGGKIIVDGADISTMNVAYLRQHMGLVSQEPVLFDYSIEDNIKYGALYRDVSEDEVRQAAISANIDTFIQSLPEGYKTRVGEKGTQLSGGQKQRIAIARALIRDPKILLLDEATSALDTESEKVVQEALDKAREGRTCLVIAHRLSTIHNADLICVIQEGRVVERGTHAELMALKGVYFNLNKGKK